MEQPQPQYLRRLGVIAAHTSAQDRKGEECSLVYHEGVGVITLLHPPVNSLSPLVLKSLKACWEQAKRNPDVKALVIIGANGKFSAGADVPSIDKAINGKSEEAAQALLSSDVNVFFNEMELWDKPIVAAVDGMAFGGGLELAMTAHYRVCTPKCQMGLPELKLGIIPGFGGTQRLPRLVGVQQATVLMLTSKFVDGCEARDIGLVDKLVEPRSLLEQAVKVARKLADERTALARSLYLTSNLDPESDGDVLKQAMAMSLERSPAMVQAPACLRAIGAGLKHGGLKGLEAEGEEFTSVASGSVSQALVHFFLAQRSCKKIPGVTDVRNRSEKPVSSVGVVGGGFMGSGIATSLVLKGYHVFVKEMSLDLAKLSVDRVQKNLASRVKKGRMTEEHVAEVLSRMHPTADYASLSGVDLIVEAVVENLKIKQAVFAELVRVCHDQCIFATNTSTINIDDIFREIPDHAKGRIVGMHFFSPAHIMPLVEIVRSASTAGSTLKAIIDVTSKIGKTPVVVGNRTGFVVNRVFFPYTMAAQFLVDHGVHPYEIDDAAKKFGMPMGPFRMADLVGFDVSKNAGASFIQDFADHIYVNRSATSLVDVLMEQGHLGEKSGSGVYKHQRRRGEKDPEALAPALERLRALNKNNGKQSFEFSTEEIQQILMFPLVNEACRVIEEDLALRSSDIDVACIFGMGFPPYRGGPLNWADQIGAKHVHDTLLRWSEQFDTPFFRPCAYLSHKARQGATLVFP